MNHISKSKHILSGRPRLIASVLLGLVVFFILPINWSMIVRILVGWNVAIGSYLCLIAWLATKANHESVKKIAEQEEESAIVVLILMSLAVVASLLAIVFELSTINTLANDVKMYKYLLTASTVFGSWCLLSVIFSFHYAVIFYASPREIRALRFPEDEINPNYWDFLYFSFTIAVAAQTADVTILSRKMRKVVMAHAILSFFFNAAILGFFINIAASVVGH